MSNTKTTNFENPLVQPPLFSKPNTFNSSLSSQNNTGLLSSNQHDQSYNLPLSQIEELRSTFLDLASQIDIDNIIDDFSQKGYSLHVLKTWNKSEWKSVISDPIVRNLLRQCIDSRSSGALFSLSPSLSAQPSSIHFSMTSLATRSQTVQIINKNNHQCRFNIYPPETKFFRILFNHRGSIAPGMSETIKISLHPTCFRYYYDTIKIVSVDSQLSIPLHAYPIMNNFVFPKYIEMEDCIIGSFVTKTIDIRNLVPFPFEFEIIPLDYNPYFSISPLKTVISAMETITITIIYQPLRVTTNTLRVEVHLNQFAFEPFICTISASCRLPSLYTSPPNSSTKSQSQSQSIPISHSSTPTTSNVHRSLHLSSHPNIPPNQDPNYNFRKEKEKKLKESSLLFDYSVLPNSDILFEGQNPPQKQQKFNQYLNDLYNYENEIKVRNSLLRIGQKTLTSEEIKIISNDRDNYHRDIDQKEHSAHLQLSSAILSSQTVVHADTIQPIPTSSFSGYILENFQNRRKILQVLIDYVSDKIKEKRIYHRISLIDSYLSQDKEKVKKENKKMLVIPSAFNFNQKKITSSVLPLYHSNIIIRDKVDSFSDIIPFSEITSYPLVDCDYLHLYNLSNHNYDIPLYTPLFLDRDLLDGAFEEDIIRSRRDIHHQKDVTLLTQSLPNSLIQPPSFKFNQYPLIYQDTNEYYNPLDLEYNILPIGVDPNDEGDEEKTETVDEDVLVQEPQFEPSKAFYMTQNIDDAIITSYPSFPLLSSLWRPAINNRLDIFMKALPQDSLPSFIKEKPKEDQEDDDDSESDIDEDERYKFKPMIPTISMAKNLFTLSDDKSDKTESESKSESKPLTDLFFTDTPRERACIQLNNLLLTSQEERIEQLPTMINKLNEKMSFIYTIPNLIQ